MASRAYGWLALAGLTIVIGGLAGGCPPQPAADDGRVELRRFASEQEFVNFFKDQAWAQQAPQWTGFRGLFGLPAAAPDTAGEGGSGGQDNGASYSTTNIQEEGVDESDVLKSNGTHFFIARGQTVRVVKATPPEELAEVGQIDVGVAVESLYLFESKLLVLGQKYDAGIYGPGGPELMIWPPFYAKSSVIVAEVDVANPARPKITRQIELDGSIVASRLTGGNLYLVLTIVPELPASPTRLNIMAMTTQQILPKARRGGVAEPLVGWEDYYRPGSGDGYYTTAVVTLDAADIERVLGSVAVMANAGTVYASTEALYTTDSDHDALNNNRETTRIHKFAYDPQNGATYVGSGKVPGRLLNQFSLGENEGHLRVATHVDNWEFFGFGGVGFDDVAVSSGPNQGARAQARNVNEPYNAVYVLKAVGDKLEVVGSIEDIAPGEQLYSARFLGQRGFLVTFVRIDPLFVLDLSDPTDPKIMGELKIPGYSDYLHHFGEDLLIGVGQSTRQTPWGGVVPDAVQLSLFDVSDWENPKLIEQVELGGHGSYCDVSYTHKAFTFMPDRGLLAIPVVLYKDVTNPFGDNGGWSWQPQFEGVVCFNVTAEGFTELGQLAGVEPPECYWTDWRRAAIIDETLYAVSPVGVSAVDLTTFQDPHEVTLTPGENEPDPCGGAGGSSEPGAPPGVR